jgi:hypothetical protein
VLSSLLKSLVEGLRTELDEGVGLGLVFQAKVTSGSIRFKRVSRLFHLMYLC